MLVSIDLQVGRCNFLGRIVLAVASHKASSSLLQRDFVNVVSDVLRQGLVVQFDSLYTRRQTP